MMKASISYLGVSFRQ